MVISLPHAVTDMEAEVRRLDGVIHGIHEKLAQKQRNPQRRVKDWLDKADEAIQSSRSIRNEYQQHKNCLGCCPNFFCRYRICEDIRAWKLIVDQLHSQWRSDFPPSGEYRDPTPCTQIPIQHPKFAGNGLQATQAKLNGWLAEGTKIRVIGVYGMRGIGKTSLLQIINNNHEVSESFPLIIWVTISKNYDILNLQDCIAHRLKIKLPDRSNLVGQEYELYSYMKDNEFLLILDNMWRNLKLESLGVSMNDTASKIVLLIQSQVVCTKMKVDEIIPVKPLSEDGWQLFCKGAFRNGNVPQEVEDVARKIAGVCKGLWELALDQMQTVDGTFYDMHKEIEEDLFQCLKWSYDVLLNYLKTCFVYFAAYSEDKVLNCEEVIDSWIAEVLVKGNGGSLFDRGGLQGWSGKDFLC